MFSTVYLSIYSDLWINHSIAALFSINHLHGILNTGNRLELKNITHVVVLSSHSSEYSSSCVCAPDTLLTLSHLSSLSYVVVFRARLHHQIHPDRVLLLSNWPRRGAREVDWKQDSVIDTGMSSLLKDGIDFRTVEVDVNVGTMVNLQGQWSPVRSCKICMYLGGISFMNTPCLLSICTVCLKYYHENDKKRKCSIISLYFL